MEETQKMEKHVEMEEPQKIPEEEPQKIPEEEPQKIPVEEPQKIPEVISEISVKGPKELTAKKSQELLAKKSKELLVKKSHELLVRKSQLALVTKPKEIEVEEPEEIPEKEPAEMVVKEQDIEVEETEEIEVPAEPEGRKRRFTRFRSTGSVMVSARAVSKYGPTLQIPVIDTRKTLENMVHRSVLDQQFLPESDLLFDEDRLLADEHLYDRYIAKDEFCVTKGHSRHPSYTQFKLPFEMTCKQRYMEACDRYNEQFSHEIQQLIDYTSTASEASYLVRNVAYTTLWPPYHNEDELRRTSQFFYKLTPKERKRMEYIMSHDII